MEANKIEIIKPAVSITVNRKRSYRYRCCIQLTGGCLTEFSLKGM